ncbi:MAG: hypothetical protein AAGF95_29860 [Chloroflexota bacterium]
MDTPVPYTNTLGQSAQLHAQHNESIEVFHKAFSGDENAWATIQTHYACLVNYWIGSQQYADTEEVAQEAWIAFYRYAPQRPHLLQSNSTARVLAYLRSCVKTALIAAHRREKRYTMIAQRMQVHLTMPVTHIDHIVIQRMTISERVQQILVSDDERFIFHLRFVCGMKPQEIVTAYPDRFPHIQLIYRLTTQIIRHLREDPFLQALQYSDGSKSSK